MSDYDRGKYYKKKFHGQKDSGSGSGNYGSGTRNYGRRSPKYDKEPSSSKNEARDVKIKQPTILLKARDEEVSFSSPIKQKSVPKETEQSSVNSGSTVPPTNADTSASPTMRMMHKSVKFLEDSQLYTEHIADYVQENSDFLVVGIMGAQGVGKSTLMNLIAHGSVTNELKRALFKPINDLKEEEYGNTSLEILLTDNLKISDEDNKIRHDIFKVQSSQSVQNNTNTTHGIDLFITSNRVILLDCQPFASVSVLDELIQSESKRSNIVSEFIPLENSSEILGLQLTTFLMSVCHILIVVQDYFLDSNMIRFLQTAEMLKPTHSNAEDDLSDHFPHLLVVQNRAQMEDFSPEKFKTMQEVYHLFLESTKMQKDSSLGLATSRLISCINEESCGSPFNIFLVPENDAASNSFYKGHPPLEEVIKKLRALILGAVRTPLTHVQLTEKTWLIFCAKAWDNVRKSSFFVEYTKLMP